MSPNGKKPTPVVGTAHNGNGHVQPFLLHPSHRVIPRKFRGWKKQVWILEDYIARLEPEDPKRDKLIGIVLLIKHGDQLVRILIAEFVATIADSPKDALMIRRKAGFLRSGT
jgi:hypothetical protein